MGLSLSLASEPVDSTISTLSVITQRAGGLDSTKDQRGGEADLDQPCHGWLARLCPRRVTCEHGIA